jgi:hypothetical protein
MEHQSLIQKNIMRRVRVIHATRTLFRGEFAALLVMLAALYGVGREVWVAHVFQNMPSLENVSAFSNFWLAALVNTRSIVQVLIAVTIVAAVYFVREIVRALRTGGTFLPV